MSVNAPIRLISQPYDKRIGLIPLEVAIALGWFLVIFWAFQAVQALRSELHIGAISAAGVVLFAGYLAYMTYTTVADAMQRMTVELTDKKVSVTQFNKLMQSQTVDSMPLSDVRFAEYYPARDAASIILHGEKDNMEIPLWSLGDDGDRVLEFLRGHNIQVIDLVRDSST